MRNKVLEIIRKYNSQYSFLLIGFITTALLIFLFIDIDYCAQNDCKHGECVDGIDSYTCNCYAGYEGRLCDNGKQ